jgi:hypothetical protein
MDLIYKIFNAGLVGGDKRKRGLFVMKKFPNKTIYFLCFIIAESINIDLYDVLNFFIKDLRLQPSLKR